MSSQFEFVHTDPTMKLKPGKSFAVRSRVMQGKNKREDSRRSQQEKRKKAQEEAEANIPLTSNTRSVPRSPEEFSMVRFASKKIEPQDPGLIVQVFTSNVANQTMSPLEKCAEFEHIETVQFQWTFSDPAFTHLILTASHAIFDIQSPGWNGRPGTKYIFHMKETLSLLSKRLVETDVSQDEPLLYIIIQLALLAAVAGDWHAVAAHLDGLKRVVQLRGGWAFLQTRPRLHFKLDRSFDLSWCLISGNKPFFLHPKVSWQAIAQQPSANFDFYVPDAEWHPNLRILFKDFQFLARNINLNAQNKTRYEASFFQSTLSALQSRLMHLGEMLHTTLEKLVRLCMLAFLATAFKVPGSIIPYTWAQEAIETEYRQLVIENAIVDPPLRLWIILMSSILLAPQRKTWVEAAWATHNRYTEWSQVKKDVMFVLWIEGIHDQFGEAAFRQVPTPPVNAC